MEKSWQNVAICEDHWREEEGDRVPFRMKEPPPEPVVCYRCGVPLTERVIYVRRHVVVVGSHRTEDRICPHCGDVQDGATGVGTEGPSNGDAIICSVCGKWGTHDDTAPGHWRFPTSEEVAVAEASPTFALTMKAVERYREQR